jgi:uncharacterized membrane protein
VEAIREVRAEPPLRKCLRLFAIAGFILAGLNHFRHPDFYRNIIPPAFPSPAALVAISGIAEIAGGIGLAIPPLRRAAGWGLIALLIAVFPANLYMAIDPGRFADLHISPWLLWLRLPLQIVFIWWVWKVGIHHSQSRPNRPE